MNEETIFAEAVAIESAEDRSKFLDSACGDNLELRQAVLNLLKLADQAGSFLEHPALEGQADPRSGIDATIVHANSSTCDDDKNPIASEQPDMQKTLQNPDDEIPLGFLGPATRADSLGRLGHYEVLEVVGRGAFGTVLRAFDEKLQRVVAIKVLAPEMAATSPARKRFLREARTSAGIRHENVVSIHAVEDDPIPYLVMEYIPGQTLQQRLENHGPLAVLDVLKLGKQIADGLAAAHAQDLIHRDIKPGNILLEGGVSERVKITDFGLARTADDASMTQSGLIAGTPMYMAPEQALGHKLDQRADLFSFGSVLYQMLSGRPPFRAANTVAVLKRVVDDTPRPIQEIIPEVPTWMCELVGHLHAKSPDERIQTAKEVSNLLAHCLEELTAGRIPKIPSPSQCTADTARHSPVVIAKPDQPLRGDASRHRPLTRVAAAVLVLLAVIGITEATGVTKLTATVIRLATGSGTLVIETDDPSVKIAINGEEVTIPGGEGISEVSLRPGAYEIAALKDGQPLKQELVSIERNARTVVRMSLETVKSIAKSAGSPQLSSGSAVHDYALSFDGTDDSVQTPVRFDVAKPLTVEALITVPDKPGRNQVALADAELGGFGLGPRENGKWRMDLQAQASLQRDDVGYVRLESDNSIAYGTPTHVATIYDGRILRLYVNGRLQSKRIPVKDLVPSHLPIMIGANPGLNNRTSERFLGTIDEVRISNVARYTGDFTPDKRFESDEHTLALYHFDEGTGDVLKDSSGNGHHGKIVGAKWVRVNDESHVTPNGATNADGWVQLFNGKDLSGWKTHPDQPGDWKVENGVLVSQSQRNGYLFTERADFESFHLRSEVKLNGQVDSGILFHSDFEIHHQKWPSAYEANLRVGKDLRPNAFLYLLRPNSSAGVPLGPVSEALAPEDEWFVEEVIVRGDQITIKQNGKVMVDLADAQLGRRRGHLALQNYRYWVATPGIVQVRKIEIKELPATDSPAPSPAIAPFDAAQAKDHQEAWAKHLGVPVEYTNSLGLKFRLIPPGEFTMGDSEGEVAIDDKNVESLDSPAARPKHRVQISCAFHAGIHEVTVGQFRKFVEATGESTQAEASGLGSWFWDKNVGTLQRNPEFTWKSPGYKAQDDFPVTCISWHDAVRFCEWLSREEGRTYRLPTEAEWEYSCRAGTETAFSTGSHLDKAQAVINRGPVDGPVAVGTCPPNRFGLHDMHGSVMEWCADGARPYARSGVVDPQETVGSRRVMRGGTFGSSPGEHFDLQSSGRVSKEPDHSDIGYGFRVVLVVDGVKQRPSAAPAATSSKVHQ